MWIRYSSVQTVINKRRLRASSEAISRVLSSTCEETVIYLRRQLLAVLSNLPESAADRADPRPRPKDEVSSLLGLAPGGVCKANRVTPVAGALLPHHFTLTDEEPPSAVYFLLHFP